MITSFSATVPIAGHVRATVPGRVSQPAKDVFQPTFGSADALRLQRLREMFASLSADLAADKITVKKIKSDSEATLDIDGKEYSFTNRWGHYSLVHATQERVPYQTKRLKRTKYHDIRHTTIIALSRHLFWNDGRTLSYNQTSENQSIHKTIKSLGIATDKENDTMRAGEAFFLELTAKVFTPEALKPYVKDELDY